MARIDAGAVATESRWAHPSEIVAAARDQVEHTLQKHKLKVAIEQDEPVRLDPRLTATALAHVLENAAQYTPTGSTIDLTVRLSDEGVAFEVRDHGPGIAPADLPHVFDRFYRGGAAKARTSGTGMGLWIARGLLAVEHGRVWAENHPDGGAQFTIVVPGGRQGDGSGELTQLMAPSSRILLVDDEAAIQRAVGPLLRSRGYEVDIASTGSRGAGAVRHAGRRTHRPRSRTAGSRRHGSLPPRARHLTGADHRAVGARRRDRQGQRARSGRRRLCDQAVRSRRTAGAHSGGAAPRRRRKTRAERRASSGPAT